MTRYLVVETITTTRVHVVTSTSVSEARMEVAWSRAKHDTPARREARSRMVSTSKQTSSTSWHATEVPGEGT